MPRSSFSERHSAKANFGLNQQVEELGEGKKQYSLNTQSLDMLLGVENSKILIIEM